VPTTTSGAAPRPPNRRLGSRRACLLTVRYKTAKDWHPATVVNISLQGCRLRLGQELERGSAISVQFDAPLTDGATALHAEVEGTVSWSRPEGLSFQVGIQFEAGADGLRGLLDSFDAH
jgi:hypothetical protein